VSEGHFVFWGIVAVLDGDLVVVSILPIEGVGVVCTMRVGKIVEALVILSGLIFDEFFRAGEDEWLLMRSSCKFALDPSEVAERCQENDEEDETDSHEGPGCDHQSHAE
jgi:hypothetical protein